MSILELSAADNQPVEPFDHRVQPVDMAVDNEAQKVTNVAREAFQDIGANVPQLPSVLNGLEDTTYPLQDRVSDQSNEPNLALEAVELLLRAEALANKRLIDYTNEVKGHQQSIDLLLDLSGELIHMKKGKSLELSDRAKDLIGQLDARGVSVWKLDGAPLTKETLSELSTKCGDEISNLRSKIQIIFTTGIKTCSEANAALLEAFKGIVRDDKEHKRRLIERQATR